MAILPHLTSLECLTRRRCLTVGALACAATLTFASTPLMAQTADSNPYGSSESVSVPADGSSSAPDAGWSRVDASAAEGDGQVLEIPQVTDPDSEQSAQSNEDGTADPPDAAASANPASDSDDSATADPDQVGGVNDYQDQETDVLVGGAPAGGVPMPMNAWTPLGTLPAPLPMRPGTGVMPGPIIMRPSGISPIMPTSPMLTTPRGAMAMPRGPVGWWTRVGHR